MAKKRTTKKPQPTMQPYVSVSARRLEGTDDGDLFEVPLGDMYRLIERAEEGLLGYVVVRRAGDKGRIFYETDLDVTRHFLTMAGRVG